MNLVLMLVFVDVLEGLVKRLSEQLNYEIEMYYKVGSRRRFVLKGCEGSI